MKDYDVVLLTDSRYVNPIKSNDYIENVLKEDELLLKAFEKQNLKSTKKDWNDPSFDWESTKTAIFRSTWDYFDQFPIFENWLDQVHKKCKLINSFSQIKWNLNKRYLQDLESWKIPIPESVFVHQNSNLILKKIAKEKNWNHIVIKPTISGAARLTYQLEGYEIDDFQLKWINLTNQEEFIVQEFQKNVVKTGEIAIILFGGKYSHAVLKKAKKGDFRVQDDFGGTVEKINPSKDLIALAEKTIQKLKPIPFYSRVDIILNNENSPVIMELELIEPELWFRFKVDAAKKLGLLVKEFINNLNSYSN